MCKPPSVCSVKFPRASYNDTNSFVASFIAVVFNYANIRFVYL